MSALVCLAVTMFRVRELGTKKNHNMPQGIHLTTTRCGCLPDQNNRLSANYKLNNYKIAPEEGWDKREHKHDLK
eukprot:1990534-Amphidinium_carterae.1